MGSKRQDQEASPSTAASGDPPSRRLVTEALERYERPLLALAARITGDGERARDVVQEVFLRLCRARGSEIEGHLSAWLHTVCRNLALDVRRKESRMTELATDSHPERADEGPTPEQSAHQAEVQGTLLGSLARLPQKQREAVALKFQQGLSYREIAATMQTSVGNVGWLLHHGLKTLRERLADLAGDNPSTALGTSTDLGDGSLEGATR